MNKVTQLTRDYVMESRQGLVNTLQTIPVSLFFCHLSTKQREEKTRLDFFFWRKTLIPIAVNGIHQLEEPRGIVWIKNLQLVQIHSLNHSLTHSWGKTKSCVRHNVKKKKKKIVVDEPYWVSTIVDHSCLSYCSIEGDCIKITNGNSSLF